MLECLEQAKQEGQQVWLLSSSPDCIVEPIAAYLGIPITHATTYNIQDGIYKAIASMLQVAQSAPFSMRIYPTHPFTP